MTRYLISFDDGAMTVPVEDLADVAAYEVVQEAQDAGVWVAGGGVSSRRASVVATDGMATDGMATDGMATDGMATDGMVTDRPYPETKAVLGGFAIVEVSAREEALEWAAKIASACRCAQEVRELLPDPTV